MTERGAVRRRMLLCDIMRHDPVPGGVAWGRVVKHARTCSACEAWAGRIELAPALCPTGAELAARYIATVLEVDPMKRRRER